MNEDKKFEIRSYGKGELASMYMPEVAPESAAKTLRKWIERYPGLNEELMATGLSSADRRYTPAQVRMIVEKLGEP